MKKKIVTMTMTMKWRNRKNRRRKIGSSSNVTMMSISNVMMITITDRHSFF